MGAVIGEGGRTINAIRAHSGADVQVEPYHALGETSIPTMAIPTTATPTMATPTMATPTMATATMATPTMAALAMQVEHYPELGEASTQRRVVITGLEASCLRARTSVHAVLHSNTGKRDYSQQRTTVLPPPKQKGGGGGGGGPGRTAELVMGNSQLTMRIPRHLVGRIIGKRGETIKELRGRTPGE